MERAEKNKMTKYEVLKKYFGYDSFREGQEMLVDALLNGQDVLGIMPTGAGKSLLVDALLLLAGGRGDANMIRHGSERAELSASFDIRSRGDIGDWLRSEELDDEGACELRRVIRSEGQSRAWINGRPVTLTQLRANALRILQRPQIDKPLTHRAVHRQPTR